MTKQGKSTAVPRLRFSGFRDAWELKALAPYLEECGSKVAATTSLPIYSSSRSGLTPQASYYDGRTIINEGEYGVVPPGCFVYRHMSDDGQFVFNLNETGSEIAVSKEYPVFQTVDLDSKFLLAKLNHSRDFKAFALSQKAGGTRTRLYFSKLRAWATFLPSLAEQQKIAGCLTSLDEVIAAQGRKVDTLKTYKRGLMQQLFPREGETLPRLRFPEFRDAPEWKDTPLDPFIDELREKSQSQDEYEVLTSARSGLVRQRDYYDNDRITERENVGFNVIPPNYVTYRSRSDDRRFYFNENNLGITGIISTYYPVFRIRGGSNKFFIELMSQHAELVGKRSVGTSQTVLSLNELRRIKLPVPTSSEQQEIAGILASLDDAIAGGSAKLDTLKAHKKCLMQQLFPVPEEA